jgi:3-methyl-2-oxobutanoate hydroxymethyltransferase
MVLYGMRDTLSVTMDMIIAHGRAVAGQCRRACVVVDMPFASYQESEQLAFRNAARILAETGCQAVKLEGGREMAATVAYLTARGIPVMGHVGLLPQSVRHTGRFKIRGKCLREAALITADARAIHEAGALAVVVEGVHEPLAARISTDLPVPTIGIGASPACDGQILVTEDMLGLNGGNLPRFVKQYGDLADQISALVEDYAADIREVRFPESGHCYG